MDGIWTSYAVGPAELELAMELTSGATHWDKEAGRKWSKYANIFLGGHLYLDLCDLWV